MTTLDSGPFPVAIVTGAGSGLGRAFARALWQRGFAVAAFSRNPEHARETLDPGQLDDSPLLDPPCGGIPAAPRSEFGLALPPALPLGVNLLEAASVEEAVAHTTATLGPPSLLVNNAAFADAVGLSWQLDEAAWWRCFEVNVLAVHRMCRVVIPAMIAARSGRIINLVGDTGAQGQMYMSAYSASKAALARFTFSLDRELEQTGVKAFAFCPGTVATSSLLAGLEAAKGTPWLQDLRERVEQGKTLTHQQSVAVLFRIAMGQADGVRDRLVSANDWSRTGHSKPLEQLPDSPQVWEAGVFQAESMASGNVAPEVLGHCFDRVPLERWTATDKRVTLEVAHQGCKVTLMLEPYDATRPCFCHNRTLSFSVQGTSSPTWAHALLRGMALGPLADLPFAELLRQLRNIAVPSASLSTAACTPSQPPPALELAFKPREEVPYLASVEWSITSACNLTCSHCIANACEAGDNELGTSRSMQLIDEFDQLGLSLLLLTGGEFMCRPDWLLLLQHALRKLPAVMLATNGWLGETLLQSFPSLPNPSRLCVLVSLDGTQEVHDRRRGAGSFAQAWNLVSKLEPGAHCVVTAVGQDNFADLPKLRSLLRPLAVNWSLFPVQAGGRATDALALPKTAWRKLHAFIQATAVAWNDSQRLAKPTWFSGERQTPATTFGPGLAGACLFLASSGDVAADQSMTGQPVGNLHVDSVSSILQRLKNPR